MDVPGTDGKRPRLAALDVGSNTMRLVIAELEPNGVYRVLDDEREMVRLGAGVNETGRLDPTAVERALEAIGKMKALADGLRVSRLRAIATSAVRDAENGAEFCVEAQRRFDIPIEIISGAEEGRLAFRSVLRHFNLEDRLIAAVDVGGGSVEVVLAAGKIIDQVYTLPLGAVRLTEQFGLADKVDKQSWKAVRKAIDSEARNTIGRPPLRPRVIIGSGGTFSTLAEMIQLRRGEQAVSVQGYKMAVAEVEHLLDELISMTLDERKQVPGLAPGRADIIVAGALVITRLARRLLCEEIWVHDKGVRDGLLLTMIDELQDVPSAPDPSRDRMQVVRQFAQVCRCNPAHCEQVAKLAGQIFDQLDPVYDLPPEGRELMLAAALTHEAGYLINPAGRHKHAYHIIRHADLPGFSSHEIELIANVARYHRGAPPKKSHANFKSLKLADAQLVKVLAGILRVADGLDRTRFQRVRSVRVMAEGDELRIEVDAGADAQVEMWAAEEKSKLLAKTLGAKIDFERAARK